MTLAGTPATSERGGNVHSGPDEGARGDDRRLPDDHVVHDHCIHADQRVPADAAAVQHGAVADMAILLDDRIAAGEAVHDAGVLHIDAALENQASEVAAQAGTGADVAAGPDDHIADENGRRMNVAAGIHDRNDSVDGENAWAVHVDAPGRGRRHSSSWGDVRDSNP
jgi:hypothetical protein